MHELSLSRAIYGIAQRAAAGRQVTEIGIDVGALRQVVPETLSYCWAITSKNTPLAGAELNLKMIPAKLKCNDCGAETLLENDLIMRCAVCDSIHCAVLTGEEFRLTYIDLADSPSDKVKG